MPKVFMRLLGVVAVSICLELNQLKPDFYLSYSGTKLLIYDVTNRAAVRKGSIQHSLVELSPRPVLTSLTKSIAN